MKNIQKALLLILLFTGGLSCKKSYLDENPLDSFSTTNAFKTEADFNASINDLYGLVRQHFYSINDFQPFYYLYKTDAYFDITVTTPNVAADMAPRGLTNFAWAPNYKIIAEANTIISRMAGSTLTDAQKKLFEAKARFFRAFGYRTLAYLYGGVPLVLDEVTTPTTDFTRATRTQVYAQVITDLKFAAANLPSLAAASIKDGEVSVQAAQHLLAEVYLADGQFQNAVTAATAVIGDPAMSLMTSRFGRRSTVTPGDVYWDLFQRGNQNRKSGNKEAIWVIQIETDVIGGAGSTSGGSQGGVYALERVHAPLVRDVKINGVAPFLWPIANYTGGRGVGFLAPDSYYINDIWQSDFNNDIRNSNNNLVRDFYGTNPASPYFGKLVSTRNPPAGTTGINGNIVANKADRAFYPYQSKSTQVYEPPQTLVTAPANVPSAIANIDSLSRYYLTAGAGGTYIDQYMFRLSETYLLRAEAYLGLSNTTAAAADINVVRARVNATPVLPANVNIDYILDERLREFGVEEKRMLTLMRLGKWVDRVKRFNPFYASQMQDNYNLWPIPADEIERNRSAVLQQNPGY
ncbi:MAG TPA: RagB/SusD family nutrient uptake outer membrane protein [Chitinophagaceae bacterium]|nr:RagB/SusD family nutrient uptake outer membrane protein [Chitinophagaceae bacterium]